MITLKQWMETVDYRITEGSDYYGDVFPGRVYGLSAWNGDHNGWSFNIEFDRDDQTVYTVEACDYKNQRAYRLINPEFEKTFRKKAKESWQNQAWDDVDFVDLEVEEDWLEKAQAIVLGEDYDTRVKVPIDIPDEDMLQYMKLAHERDITFNQLVEEALRDAMKEMEQDPKAFKKRVKKFLKKRKHEDPIGE